MSLPFYSFKCSGCHFDDSFSYSQRYVYEGQPDHEPDLANAWCADCDKIVKACLPLSTERAEEEISHWSPSIANNKRGFFARFSKRKKEDVAFTEGLIDAIRARQSYFETISFVNKCLNCCGSHVFPILLPDGNDYGEWVSLGLEHKCGGQMSICIEGRISYSGGSQVIFDECGSILLDERSK